MSKISLSCPCCCVTTVKKNGRKPNGKQNYRCKSCDRQFIGDHALTYLGCHSKINQKILLRLVRGCGIRDIAAIEKISCGKVLPVLLRSSYKITPKRQYYEKLEVDEFWTFVGNKKRKQWLIYAYDSLDKEIVLMFGGNEMWKR